MPDIAKLHVVTPPFGDDDDLALTAALVEAGAPLIQVRTKDTDDRRHWERAAAVVPSVRAGGATCVVNDRADIALATGASGVHVGAQDLPADVVRRLLGPDAVIGVTCRDPEQAREAEAAGATYLGVGPVYATRTKGGLPDPMGPRGIEAVARAVDVPVIAVSGVTADNAADVLDAGAWGIAVVGAVYGAPDPVESLRRLLEVTSCG